MHGAAGGVGTATIQVARGYGARTIAVVSTEAKGELARAAGADEVVLLDGFKDAVAALTGSFAISTSWSTSWAARRSPTRCSHWPPGPAARGRLRLRPGHPRGAG